MTTLDSTTGSRNPGGPSACTAEGDPRRWKNAPLTQRLFIIHNLMMRIGDRLVADLGLTSSRWLLLGAVEQFEQPPTLSELSNSALLSLQNVSRMVASMEADGLVRRITVPGCGRSTFVTLTDRGREVHQRAEDAARVFAAGFLEGFSESEIEETERRLERLLNNLEALESAVDQPNRGGKRS